MVISMFLFRCTLSSVKHRADALWAMHNFRTESMELNVGYLNRFIGTI